MMADEQTYFQLWLTSQACGGPEDTSQVLARLKERLGLLYNALDGEANEEDIALQDRVQSALVVISWNRSAQLKIVLEFMLECIDFRSAARAAGSHTKVALREA